MTRVDWVIVVFAAVTATAGFRRGLIGTVLALAGLVLGAIVGARVAYILAWFAKHDVSATRGQDGSQGAAGP